MLKSETRVELASVEGNCWYAKLLEREIGHVVALYTDCQSLYEYDTKSGELLSKMSGIFDEFADPPITMSNDCQLIAYCNADNNVIIMKIASSTKYCTVQTEDHDKENAVQSIRFSPNNQMIVILCEWAYYIYQIEENNATLIQWKDEGNSSSILNDEMIIWNEFGIYMACDNDVILIDETDDYSHSNTIISMSCLLNYLLILGVSNEIILLAYVTYFDDERYCEVWQKPSVSKSDEKHQYIMRKQWNQKYRNNLTATLINNQLIVLLSGNQLSIYNWQTESELARVKMIDDQCIPLPSLCFANSVLMICQNRELIFCEMAGIYCDHLWFENGSVSHADYQAILLSAMRELTPLIDSLIHLIIDCLCDAVL